MLAGTCKSSTVVESPYAIQHITYRMSTDRSKKKDDSGMGTKNGVLAVRGGEQEEKRDLGRGRKGCTYHIIIGSCAYQTLDKGLPAPGAPRYGTVTRPQGISQVRVTHPGVILIEQGY